MFNLGKIEAQRIGGKCIQRQRLADRRHRSPNGVLVDWEKGWDAMTMPFQLEGEFFSPCPIT
jgi:hypothetical protein